MASARRPRTLGAALVVALGLAAPLLGCGGKGVSTYDGGEPAVDAGPPSGREAEPTGDGTSGGRGGVGADAASPAPRFTCDTADTPARRATVTVAGNDFPSVEPYTAPPGAGVYDLVETVLSGSVASAGVSKGAVLRIGNGWKRSDDFGDGVPVASVAALETVVPLPDYALYGRCGPWPESLWRFHVTATGFEAYRYTGGVRYVERFERRP